MKIIYILATLYLICFATAISKAEDLEWYRKKWPDSGQYPGLYVEMASRYMGPNAIPVPELYDGAVDSVLTCTTRFDYHFRKGETTKDIQLMIDIPIQSKKLAVKIWLIPKEYYNMDTIVRDEYKAYTNKLNKSCTGDMYLSLRYNFWGTSKSKSALGSSLTYRYPSGGDYEARRYSDMPGYFGTIEGFKRITTNSESHFDLLASCGFFNYQTNKQADKKRQNEAIYGALGGRFLLSNKEIGLSINGYRGNINNGDRPAVVRAYFQFQKNKQTHKFGFQSGLNDYNYNTFSWIWSFNLKKERK